MFHVIHPFEPRRTEHESTSENLIRRRYLPSYDIFVHCEPYLIKIEHFSIWNYPVLSLDTKYEENSVYMKENSIDHLLFLVEFVMLFEYQRNFVQTLDQFDYQARCK